MWWGLTTVRSDLLESNWELLEPKRRGLYSMKTWQKRARPLLLLGPHGPPLRQHHVHDGHRRPLTKVLLIYGVVHRSKNQKSNEFFKVQTLLQKCWRAVADSQVDKLRNETDNLSICLLFSPKNAERIVNFKAHWCTCPLDKLAAWTTSISKILFFNGEYYLGAAAFL